MSAEPFIPAQPVHPYDLADPGVTRIYSCKVSVVDDRIETEFSLDGQQVKDPPIIASGGSTQIVFTIITKGYSFKELSQTLRDSDMGSFRWDFHPTSPRTQTEAGFCVPPALWRLNIEPDSRSASIIVTNRYFHREPHVYSLVLSLNPPRGFKVPEPHDPTLIEDPYDGPRESDERLPRRG